MANLLEDAADWMATQLADYTSRSIKYRRLAPESDPIDATLSLRTFDAFDTEAQTTTEIEVSQWMLRRSSLTIDGDAIEPRVGDRLRDLENGQEYEVFAPSNGPCFRPTDQAGVMIVIYTNRVT